MIWSHIHQIKEANTQCGESVGNIDAPAGEKDGIEYTGIPFNLVGNIYELHGAFDYGKYIVWNLNFDC